MTPDPFENTKAALAELGGQRVWSLMVTLFGDLARAPGDTIQGTVLSEIMAAMDIRPEAVRVALHRLRNDGWIASVKKGRTSSHSLTAFGRAQSAAASARIYAEPGSTPDGWQLALLEDGGNMSPADMLSAGFAPLMPRVYIGGATASPVPGAAMARGEAVPDWLRAQFEPPALARDYAALHEVLKAAANDIPAETPLSPLQCAVLRCLVVHNWRRLVLKHPDLPAALYTPDWKGQQCHQLVSTLLHRFPRPSIDAITDG